MSHRDNRVSRRANRSAALAVVAAAFAVLHTLPPPAHAMYDPHHGRRLQRDPLGVRPDPLLTALNVAKQYADGTDLYEYVQSEPTNAVDPDGHLMIAWTLARRFFPCVYKSLRDTQADVDQNKMEKEGTDKWTNNGCKMWHCIQACRFLHECFPCESKNWLSKRIIRYRCASAAGVCVTFAGATYEVCTLIGIGDPSFDGQYPWSWAWDTPVDLVANLLGVQAWVGTDNADQCPLRCLQVGANDLPGPKDTAPPPKTE